MVVQAKDIMTKEVLTVKEDMTVKEVAKFLVAHRISGAPVADENNKLKGIVTEADLIVRNKKIHIPTVVQLLEGVIYLESPKKFEEEMGRILGQKVSEVMTKEVVTIKPDTYIEDIATIMSTEKKYLLPVMEKDKIMGIVGKADVVRAIAKGEA
jgi:CBS-domain-containing membrane protein